MNTQSITSTFDVVCFKHYDPLRFKTLHEKVILPKFVGVRKYVINSEAI